ncbi:RND efflux system, outer membrane lipoprotein, NodT [Nitrospirillum viridazoti Y2]|uniref:NodT family efflux transporter outer membrane factor (OMF) lipoprotein n=1 Tax=Nitrospirillum amazonense TaxID=28077 RepID=A0A560J101_9PROT|nr:efflux transporter outer membrane subunit [Nitrospirillum amazonense]EGY01968.1 RND efflux system, outer membrane lipoprotein, NodT [Nitrospirillum amazonense Y2]TWB64445.1 NodT family efflux transporter outer membrane factor (OMF) lipoprotein [Nitrospirillum amazonense]
MRFSILFALTLTVSACSLVPPHQTPEPPIPAVFPNHQAAPPGASAAGLGRAEVFRDPRLLRIIDVAFANNRDLRLAMLNVEAARAQSRTQTASMWPGVDAQTSYSHERTAGLGERQPATADQHGASIGLTAFELDLFGRMRALSDAAFSRYLASAEGFQAARVTLTGAVADAYFAERLAVEQRALADRMLADWRRSLELSRILQQSGRGGTVDVVRAEAQVASAEADLHARERAAAQAGNALRLVVGVEVPADLPPPLALDLDPVVTRLPAGLPSDLLLNRPDIRQAERTLAAANADVGAARAAFFPRLSLTATFGFASPSLAALFNGEHNGWNFSPRVVLPIFDGGKLNADLDLAKVRKNEAVAQYEKAIQTAFREVADGLAGIATFSAQIKAQTRAVTESAHAVGLAEARYRAGLDSSLELLDAQRQLQMAQQALLSLRREEIANAVALYRALGGGAADGCPPPGV